MAGATTEELRRRLRRSEAFDAEETAQAELLLDLATGTVEDETGQALEQSTDTVTVDGTGTARLVLPRWPVTAVASVTLTEDGELLTEGEDYTWSAAGILTRRGACWPCDEQAVEVEYTAGFSVFPSGVKRIVLRLAAAAWPNPTNLSSETLGDLSRSWSADDIGMELSAADRRTLGAYRART